MKNRLIVAALLLGGAAQAQTTPTTTSPASAMPSPTDPKIKPIGTIDQSPPPTQQPTQERVRKRQTVMDGKASPGVENTDKQRSRRTKAKKPRPARAPESTGPPQ